MKDKIRWWKNELISFNGRLNRRKFIIYWLAALICSLFLFLLGIAISDRFPSVGTLIFIILMGFYILNLVIQFSIRVRRLHDLNHSGYFVLFSFVPLINIFLLLYLLGAPSKHGENKYGVSLLGD